MARAPNFIDLTGQTFGRLTVLNVAWKTEKHTYWRCRCVCGRESAPASQKLRSARIVSCGCHRAEVARRPKVHGEASRGQRTSAFWTLHGMRQRCLNPRSRAFPDYGGRGITICARWLHGEGGVSALECFIADMGPKPSSKHTIDRRDNDAGYSPNNCRWATKQQQAQNRRPARKGAAS